MPKPPHRPAALANKMFRGSDALNLGLLTRSELRSSQWRPLFRGIYADKALVVTHRIRCLAVSDFLLPSGAVIAGRSAAYLHGAPYDVDAPVEVLTPTKFGPINGLIIHQGPVPEPDIASRMDGIRATTPQRTCWDLVRWLDVVEAVVLLDILVAKRVISVAALTEYAQARVGAPGSTRLMRTIKLIDPAAESPQETRLRVRLVLAGLPTPVVQHVVERGGRFLARLDLAWPEHRIAVEYDGARLAEPPQPPQPERDRGRPDPGQDADWLVLRLTAQRLRDDFDGIVTELKAALRARKPR